MILEVEMKHLLHQCLAKCRLHLHFELVNKFRPRSCEVPPKNLQATHQITVRITFTNLHGTAHNISNTPDHSAHYIHKPPRNSTQCLTDQSHNTTSPKHAFRFFSSRNRCSLPLDAFKGADVSSSSS